MWLKDTVFTLVFFVQATEVKMNEVEFNPQFVSRMIPKLEWSVLVKAAEEVSQTVRTVNRYHISMNTNPILENSREENLSIIKDILRFGTIH